MSTCPGGPCCPWDGYEPEHHSILECGMVDIMERAERLANAPVRTPKLVK